MITASADALTTVENARAYVGRPDDFTPELTLRVQLLINAYSAAIRRYTARQFLPLQAGLARRYRYDGAGYLSLSPSEATAVTSVVLGTDLPVASQRTLVAQSASVESEYRLEPRQKTYEGTYLWLVLPELGRFNRTAPVATVGREMRGYEVTVTGNWGAGVVPSDVELACLIAVANAFRNPEKFGSRSLGALSFAEGVEAGQSDESGFSLPQGSRSLLYPYRHVAYS